MRKNKSKKMTLIKYITIAITLALGTVTTNAALLVSNVVASQNLAIPNRPIEITYDLFGATEEGVNIAVEISTNAIDSYTLDPLSLYGDVGNGITNGLGRKIVWTSVFDWPSGTYSAVKFKVIAFDEKSTADPDVIMKPVGVGIINSKLTDTLEWDLQSFILVSNLQYSPFYCKDTEVTAAQYCRFLNAYKSRFTDKEYPCCAVTSVFNNAQGSAWVDIHLQTNLCTIRAIPTNAFNNAYSKIKWDSGSGSYRLNVSDWYTNQPMTEVTWYGAVAYCMWLNEKEFGSDVVEWKYRLPTEWEFELMLGAKIYTAFDGKQDWGSSAWKYGTCHDTFSYIHNLNDWINCYPDDVYGLHGVGTKPVSDQSEGYGHNATNTFGCYEISGNVWEWCLDWWGALPADVSGKNYVYRTGGNKRTIRGGGWHSSYWDSETSSLGYDFPANHSYYVGFRVVRDCN